MVPDSKIFPKNYVTIRSTSIRNNCKYIYISFLLSIILIFWIILRLQNHNPSENRENEEFILARPEIQLYWCSKIQFCWWLFKLLGWNKTEVKLVQIDCAMETASSSMMIKINQNYQLITAMIQVKKNAAIMIGIRKWRQNIFAIIWPKICEYLENDEK